MKQEPGNASSQESPGFSRGEKVNRPRTRQQQHTVQILWAKPPGGGPVLHGWQCTCGDSEVFIGATSLRSAWTTAQMHAKIWRGVVA